MDSFDAEENLFAPSDAKLHGENCKKLYAFVCKISAIFPDIEAVKPKSKSGIEALCSLQVSLNKAKLLLTYCSESSKFYLAITGGSIIKTFEKSRRAFLESLRKVEDIVPSKIRLQILDIVHDLESTKFVLGQTEKQIGDNVAALLRKQESLGSSSDDHSELEPFYQAASKMDITSSRTALVERRALKKLIEKARGENDDKKGSIATYLLDLMRKYSKHLTSELTEDTDSQGSSPCSPSIDSSLECFPGPGSKDPAFERNVSKLSSLNLQQNRKLTENLLVPPAEFLCPISSKLMYDPVVIASGQTCERACIEKWFIDGHTTCPKTKQQLANLVLTPNCCVKDLIASWCKQNGVAVPDGPPDTVDMDWSLATSPGERTDSGCVGSINSCNLKDAKELPSGDSAVKEKLLGEAVCNSVNSSALVGEIDRYEKYKHLLPLIYDDREVEKQREAVQHVRFVLRNDEEARTYMGENGFVEALLQFLNSALQTGDVNGQEVGTMALYNLAVKNNRNKELIFSSEVIIPMIEEMIQKSETCESAIALFLNLSCLNKAKPIMGSSKVVPLLVEVLQPDSPYSKPCKRDALHSVYNLATHPVNIPSLLSCDIIGSLHSQLISPVKPSVSMWTEMILTILILLSSSTDGRKGIISTSDLVSTIAKILDSGEPTEQEQAMACLLILCNGDDSCIQTVLQEGVLPAVMMLSVNGSAKVKDKAHKFLQLFREQRQRDPSYVQMHQQEQLEAQGELQTTSDDSSGSGAALESQPLSSSRSKTLGRSISSFLKHRSRSASSSKTKSKSSAL